MAQDLPSCLRILFLGTLSPPAPGLLFPQEIHLGRCSVHCLRPDRVVPVCLVSELRVTWTQLPPGRGKGLSHHTSGYPDSCLPGPHPINPSASIPVLSGGLHGRGRQVCVGYQ